MIKTAVTGFFFILLFISASAYSQHNEALQAENQLKKYINYVIHQVKTTEDPDEKRMILDESLRHLTGALQAVERITGLTEDDQNFVEVFRNDIQEKKDELHGINGFSQVRDHELNDFADYIQQDLEQLHKHR